MTLLHSANCPQRPTVREAVLDLMRRFRLTTIFGNPGSTELPMFRDFPSDFRYVLGLQEATVVGMADGYAQASGRASIVNLHSAAGVGNAMGNIFTAFKNRTPLVITAGQQARSILPYAPFLGSERATELASPYVKWSIEPARAEDVPQAIAHAYYMAMMPPRGPTLVSVPVDDWEKPCEYVEERLVSQRVHPDRVLIARIGNMLNESKRPAFVVGPAIDRDDAWNEVVQLAEVHNARVWAAPMSGRCSFPENHRLFAGFLAAMRDRIVDTLDGHDLVLVIGASAFTYHVEGAGRHIPEGAALCQLIDDPHTAASSPVGVCAIGSVRLALQDLLTLSAPPPRPEPEHRRGSKPAEASIPMSSSYVLQTLSHIRRDTDVIVEEAPTARAAIQEYLPITQTGGFYAMDSGGLGYGMPAAVGVALARPDIRVICVIGDGSSMYSIQALWSAAQLQLPITFLVLNNKRYAALQGFSAVFGFGSDDVVQGTELPSIDFVALAKGLNCDGVYVSQPEDLHSVLDRALNSLRPTVVEVAIA